MRPLTALRDRDWLLLSHEAPRIAEAAAGRVVGRVRLPEVALPLSARVRLGWFITEAGKPPDDRRLAEGRLELVATEKPAEYAFTLDAAALALRHGHPFCTLWIDLVREGEHWYFQAEGGGALRIDISLPAPLLGDAFGMAMLQNLLSAAGQRGLFHAIRIAEERHCIGQMLRDQLLETEALLPATRPLRLRADAPAETDPQQQPAQLAAALLSGTPWLGFGPADAAYFHRMRLRHERTGLPLSQAMLDAMAMVEPAVLPAALDNPDALRRWWLWDVLLAHPLPIEALPSDHRRHWLAPFVIDDIAPANRWLVEAWERETGATRGFDPLQDAPERLAFQLSRIIGIRRDHRLSALLGREAQEFWAQSIRIGDRQASLLTLLATMALPTHAPMPDHQRIAALGAQCQTMAARLASDCPGLAPLLGQAATEAKSGPAFLLGFRRDAAAARALCDAAASLARQGIARRLFDADARRPMSHHAGRLRDWGEAASNPPGEGLDQAPSLFFCQASRLPALLRDPALSGIAARRRIGVFEWPFAALPRAEAEGALEADVICVTSAFTQDAFQRATGRPAVILPPVLALPESLPDPYAGLIARREAVFVFHSAVEAGVGLRLANPSAVIAAFAQAFPAGHEPVALALHAPDDIGGHSGDPMGEWALIQEAAAADPRIVLIEDNAGQERLMGFAAHADCVVTAHRSTGFGMPCAQAHALGVPLIAPAYGGQMEYCDADNTWLVDVTLRDIQPGEHSQDLAAPWADVNLPQLAARMQAVMAETETARIMAARGQAKVRETYSAARLDAAMESLLRDAR